jgi:LPLT family lysophospholipid transporter-like MFS transporter
MLVEFWQAVVTLVKDPAAFISLLGTSLFWGTGATLRLMLFVWVPLALGMTDNQTPANLMGVLSIGIVIGAVLAATTINLKNVHKAFIGGLLIGPVVIVLALQTNIYFTAVCLIILGAAGGLFVVPLNALLQQRGHASVGAGHALAIQNLFENIAMLILVTSYSSLATYPVTITMTGLGGLMLITLAGLYWKIKMPK